MCLEDFDEPFDSEFLTLCVSGFRDAVRVQAKDISGFHEDLFDGVLLSRKHAQEEATRLQCPR